MSNDYNYKLEKVRKIVDGDTMDLIVSTDIGFHLTAMASIRVRLLEIDTPEKKIPEQKAKALAAQAFSTQWFEDNAAENIRVETYLEDSFGRWLARVYFTDSDITFSLSKELYLAGYQKPGSKYGPKVPIE